jgi:hypothetical protein
VQRRAARDARLAGNSVLTDREAGYGQSMILVSSDDNCAPMSAMLGVGMGWVELGRLKYSQIVVLRVRV